MFRQRGTQDVANTSIHTITYATHVHIHLLAMIYSREDDVSQPTLHAYTYNLQYHWQPLTFWLWRESRSCPYQRPLSSSWCNNPRRSFLTPVHTVIARERAINTSGDVYGEAGHDCRDRQKLGRAKVHAVVQAQHIRIFTPRNRQR